MEKNNVGKNVIIGIIVGVAIIVAIVIGMMSAKKTNQEIETQNMTNTQVEKNDEDMPEENRGNLQPEEEQQVGG